jgi:hypothetical protein
VAVILYYGIFLGSQVVADLLQEGVIHGCEQFLAYYGMVLFMVPLLSFQFALS